MVRALAILIALAGCGPTCEERGGHITTSNCRHEDEPVLMGFMDFGNGMQIPMYTWQDTVVCDHWCVGAREVPK